MDVKAIDQLVPFSLWPVLGRHLVPAHLPGWNQVSLAQCWPQALADHVTHSYLIDVYTVKGASAVAANTIMRSIFAAALPLIAQPMFHNLGVDWACTLLGCIAVALAAIPFLFIKYGKALRARSRLVSCFPMIHTIVLTISPRSWTIRYPLMYD